MQVLNIVDWLEEKFEPVREWIISQSDNPVFWIAILFIGLAVFRFVYSALQKEK